MHVIDYLIIATYLLGMLGVGLFFLRRQGHTDEYFVGDRRMGAGHVGLSVVATDVGGGFSIGLGGLGFAMGLSGSWLLFTGLLGALLSAVIVLPRVKPLGDRLGWLTYPDFLQHRFDGRTRLLAAIVSAVGYAAFVGSQILAGAKLSSVAFDTSLTTAVWVMAAVVVLYTAFGGLQAVIFTDTIQWAVLLGGLMVALPFAWSAVGGWPAIHAALPPEHFSLTNLSARQAVTWGATIVPIWFVANTLYQRIYAVKDLPAARRAWYFAGLLEWPAMAFLGAVLGMLGRVMFPTVDPEMGLPLLIKEVLPVGVVGLVLAVYFSAIMSTADSCLLASVGNAVNDVYQKYLRPAASHREVLGVSRLLTLVVGVVSVAVALWVPQVLDAVLLAYSFMVSGLFVPTLAGLLWPRVGPRAAFWSMLSGGASAVGLAILPDALGPPGWARAIWPGPAGETLAAWLAEPILIALPLSAVVLVAVTWLVPEEASAGAYASLNPGDPA